ncbi:hypothetical protein PLESTF_000784400 [Pleodorina starrii]|nr:hypothetical protein PLESTF_000784400 [Pleodorina starrii]
MQDESTASTDKVKVLVIGKNGSFRGKAYLPPLMGGGAFLEEPTENVKRFRLVDWPVTGILPRMMSKTAVSVARDCMGLTDKTLQDCLKQAQQMHKA